MKPIILLLLLSSAMAMSLVPPDSAADMSTLVWATPTGDDWIASSTVNIGPWLYHYNSSAATPMYYHPSAKMLENAGTIPVFTNTSGEARDTALEYISNGSACNSTNGDINYTGAYPTSCHLMFDRATGNWVDWEHNSAFAAYVGGTTPDCDVPEYPPTYLLLVSANTVRYAFGFLGAGIVFDTVMVIIQAMMFFTFLAMLVSVVTTIPKVMIR